MDFSFSSWEKRSRNFFRIWEEEAAEVVFSVSFLLEAVGEFPRKEKKYVSTLKEHHQRMLMLLQPDFEEGKEKETFKV